MNSTEIALALSGALALAAMLTFLFLRTCASRSLRIVALAAALVAVAGIVFSGMIVAHRFLVKPKAILVVLSGVDAVTGNDGLEHPTGYWLEEFSVPYAIFKQNGFDVVVATPDGNRPTADPSSIALGKDGAPLFWGSKEAYDAGMKIKDKVLDKGPIASLVELNKKGLDRFAAVFFPGGHAPMEDLAIDPQVGQTLRFFHEQQRPTALVCHGPIALLSTIEAKEFPYKGYHLTAFSNSEEKSSEVGKFLKTTPETALSAAGAIYSQGPDWKAYVAEDRELLTGQNPASSKAIAEALVRKIAQ